MRKLIAGPLVLASLLAVGGCAGLGSSPPPGPIMEMTAARQNVKIYDVMPQYSTPIEQITATACDGTEAVATNRLLDITLQRGGNGLTGLACRSEGMSFSCWKSSTCTATAINVAPPPPPPPPPPRRIVKPKPKR
jgi:hypothetical protein